MYSMKGVALVLLLVLAAARGGGTHEGGPGGESAWEAAAALMLHTLDYDNTPVVATGLGAAGIPVPEPPGWALFGVGVAGVAYAVRRRFIRPG